MSYPPPYDPNQATPPAYDPNQAPPPYNPAGYQPSGYPVSPVQPPKKSKTGLIVGIVLGVVLLLCAVCGVGGYYVLYSANEAIEDLPNIIPSVDVATGNANGSHTVRYAVEGSGQAMITYAGGTGGTVSDTVTLPWSKEITVESDSFGLTVIAFGAPGSDAKLTGCTIHIDGKEETKRTSPGAAVTCSAFFVAG